MGSFPLVLWWCLSKIASPLFLKHLLGETLPVSLSSLRLLFSVSVLGLFFSPCPGYLEQLEVGNPLGPVPKTPFSSHAPRFPQAISFTPVVLITTFCQSLKISCLPDLYMQQPTDHSRLHCPKQNSLLSALCPSQPISLPVFSLFYP